ncbi:MAG: rhs protein, partial [uncultured bacterium]
SNEKNKIEFKKPKSHISGKEGAKNAPSWAKGNKPYKNESGKDFAKRLMDAKYGRGNYQKDSNPEFNKIKKWGDRAWE